MGQRPKFQFLSNVSTGLAISLTLQICCICSLLDLFIAAVFSLFGQRGFNSNFCGLMGKKESETSAMEIDDPKSESSDQIPPRFSING